MDALLWNILVVLLIVTPLSGEAITNSTSDPPEIINPGDLVKCSPVAGKPKWCACKSSTSNMIIDVSSMEIAHPRHRKPSYTAKGYQESSKGWYIAWSPCNDFDIFVNETVHPWDKACINTGFARYTNLSVKYCESYGSHQKSAFLKATGTDGHSRLVLYQMFRDDALKIKVIIRMMCAKSGVKSPKLTYGPDKDGILRATFTGNCCCEGACANISITDPPPSVPSPSAHSKASVSKNNWLILVGSISGAVILAVIIVIAIKNRPRPGPPPVNLPIPVVDNPEDQEERRQEQRPLLE